MPRPSGAGADFDMDTIKVYRNINAGDKFLGLEFADGCVLLLAFCLAFMVNREGLLVNAVLLLAVYLGLRAFKRGKPDGYMLVLARFVLMSRFKRAPGFEEVETTQ
ncbi:MAG: hypothetical protein PHF00_13405 [Elusimicrobia bacterium]|nr:hypothetical protein [Elusimicrobiota bacterium]